MPTQRRTRMSRSSTHTTAPTHRDRIRSWSAAVCAMLLVGGCGESATEQKAKAFAAHVRVYGTTPSDAARALAKLKTPPGFRAQPCRIQTPHSYTRCFVRRPSVVLDDSAMQHLVAETGSTLWHGISPAVACSRPRHFAIPQPSLQVCDANVTVGAERLVLFTQSLVLAGATTARGTTRSWRNIPAGTELSADVVGHFLHEGMREGEE